MAGDHPSIPEVAAYTAEVKQRMPDIPTKLLMLLEAAFTAGWRARAAAADSPADADLQPVQR